MYMVQSCSNPTLKWVGHACTRNQIWSLWFEICFGLFRTWRVKGLGLNISEHPNDKASVRIWPLLEVGPKLDFDSNVSLGRNFPKQRDDGFVAENMEKYWDKVYWNSWNWEIHGHSCSLGKKPLYIVVYSFLRTPRFRLLYWMSS